MCYMSHIALTNVQYELPQERQNASLLVCIATLLLRIIIPELLYAVDTLLRCAI